MGSERAWAPAEVSAVARSFGAHAATDVDGAGQFIRAYVPSSWKPRIVSQDVWNDLQGNTFGTIQHGIWLDNFPRRIRSPGQRRDVRGVWQTIGRLLKRKLQKIEGAVVEDGCARITDRPPHVWRWPFSYKLRRFRGVVTVWIIPQGERAALLIASLAEVDLSRLAARRPR